LVIPAATSLTLAQKHYQLRFDELHQLILAEENAFKYERSYSWNLCKLTPSRTILNEIEEIKAGKWDGQITSSLTSQTSATQEVPVDTSVLSPCLSLFPSISPTPLVRRASRTRK
jgi:hypothetical protein